MTIALNTERIPSPGGVITFDQLSWEEYELLRHETEGRNIQLGGDAHANLVVNFLRRSLTPDRA